MKLVTAIVHNEDAATLVDALLEKEYRATRFNSSGGFLKQGNATIILGVEDDQVDDVLGIISANCHSASSCPSTPFASSARAGGACAPPAVNVSSASTWRGSAARAVPSATS